MDVPNRAVLSRSKVPETQSCQSVQSASKCGGPSRVRRPRRGHSPPNVSSEAAGMMEVENGCF